LARLCLRFEENCLGRASLVLNFPALQRDSPAARYCRKQQVS
jgi:hypothetical protein